MLVASAYGKYLVALARVIPGHDELFPEPIYFNHVERTGYPDAVWKYLIKAVKLGKS